MIIIPENPDYFDAANKLAKQFSFTFLLDHLQKKEEFWLHLGSDGLSLHQVNQQSLRIDFAEKNLQYRFTKKQVKENLAKAVGVTEKKFPLVVDATAGLGKDAFLLAALGCHVIAVERSPVIFALLADGMQRASLDPYLNPITRRITLYVGEALDYLHALQQPVDVIYVDPMFPKSNKTAKVNKAMQFLQALLPNANDVASLINLARIKATQRIVIKRSLRASFIIPEKPNFQLLGKSTRFDVYLPFAK